MKRFLGIFLSFLLFGSILMAEDAGKPPVPAPAQPRQGQTPPPQPVPVEPRPADDRGELADKQPVETRDQKDKKDAGEQKGKNLNLDAKMLYGQFNRIYWDGSITQDFKNFTYQLKSDFRRSNDFGYKRSSFFQNEIGFTGAGIITDTWKITPEFQVNNDSFGMIRNPSYSREEKDKVSFKIKNEFKPMPTRWEVNVGGAYYGHRLEGALLPLTTSSSFYKGTAEFVWEYIWSSNNSLRLNANAAQYWHSYHADNDSWVATELLWGFKLTEYLKFGLGPVYAYNRDRDHFVSGKFTFATVGLSRVALDISYLYDMKPFEPENYYYGQKYMMPNYRLAPGIGHKAEAKLSVELKRNSTSAAYLSKVRFKAVGTFETNDKYNNYLPTGDQVLTSLPTRILFAQGMGDLALGFVLKALYMELGAKYHYFYPYASRRITYHAEHELDGFILLRLYRLEVEFHHRYRTHMYAHPYLQIQIQPLLLAYGTVQLKVKETFYIYGRVDNIYNRKYSLRWGYPEPGRTVIGGIRILI